MAFIKAQASRYSKPAIYVTSSTPLAETSLHSNIINDACECV
jgi:hypothetical protein